MWSNLCVLNFYFIIVNLVYAQKAHKVCIGTNFQHNINSKSTQFLKYLYTGCTLIYGNLEIGKLSKDSDDLSFLDEIEEITGYLFLFETNLEILSLKNLKIIRGQELYESKFGVYIDGNKNLKYLNLPNLVKIQRGSIHMSNNTSLCHVDKVNWQSVMSTKMEIFLQNNSDMKKCKNCCTVQNKNKCECWFQNINTNNLKCNPNCETCSLNDKNVCCDKECLGGCYKSNECLACKNFQISQNNKTECVENCYYNKISNTLENRNKLFNYATHCAETCDGKWYNYKQSCILYCPLNTYESVDDFGKKICKPCTHTECPKVCRIEDLDGELDFSDFDELKNCEILNNSLIITNSFDENDLEILSSVRIIRGSFRIESNSIKTLGFLRNLEIIRGVELEIQEHSLHIESSSLKALNLQKLRKIENGEIYIMAKSLCLSDKINWNSITESKAPIKIADQNCENYFCQSTCDGCFPTCVECHSACRQGCYGPTINDCFLCTKFSIETKSGFECINECPSTHYSEANKKICKNCALECNGCKGPDNTISDYGCLDCNITLVNINNSPFGCSYNSTFVCPYGYAKYLLGNKFVCRKCHEECDGCNEIKSSFEQNCIKCKHFFRNKTKECVNSCFSNEYLDKTTKVCYSCSNECKFGCKDSAKECLEIKQSFNTIALIVFGSILILVIVIIGYKMFNIMKIRAHKLKIKIIENEKLFFDTDNQYDNETNLVLIKENELEKCHPVGKGEFGTVYIGFYKPGGITSKKFRVAIKELHFSSNKDQIKFSENEIINEAMVMASVKHKNCHALRGLCMALPIKMVSQFIEYGSIVTFFKKYKNKVEEQNLLIWAQQIAEGMDYLESLNIVHRDLAARNVLVDNLNQIKITDFGLAKILDSEEKYFYAARDSKLPVKWLAIESIENRKFTHKSDVWSYGVCLWEIFTFCLEPYDIIHFSDLLNELKNGVRLAKPKIVRKEVYAIMLKCWHENPDSRPLFKELSDLFSIMAQSPKKYLSLKLDNDTNFFTINNNKINLIESLKYDEIEAFENSGYDLSKNESQNVIRTSSIRPDEGIYLNNSDDDLIYSNFMKPSPIRNKKIKLNNKVSNSNETKSLIDATMSPYIYKTSKSSPNKNRQNTNYLEPIVNKDIE